MIYLIPVGGMDDEMSRLVRQRSYRARRRDISSDEEPLRWLMAPLEGRFGCPCAIGEGVAMPSEAYNPRRGQCLSSAILHALESRLLPDAVRVLGVADVDLAATHCFPL